ncbi:hypothetical protein ACHAXR_010996 [Thalassiosira sp. AJA248-18]
MMKTPPPLPSSSMILFLLATTITSRTAAFSAGKGFGSSPASNNNAFVTFDRFRPSCPADINAIRQFDPSLIKEGGQDDDDDVWVAVYRSANNLPSVFVRDQFMDAMKVSTTAQSGDSETLVSSVSTSVTSSVVISPNSDSKNNNNNDSANKPVAVARLGKDVNTGYYILDSMRCVLKKENTNADCDGGSEHAEAIGVCIDELVLSYLQRYLESNNDNNNNNNNNEEMTSFDGGIHFRGTLVSGKLLDSRGFRETSKFSTDFHSHESDYDGALAKYAERSTSTEIAKNPGARDRALKIVSCLGRVDRDEDLRRAKEKEEEEGGGDDDGESDYDPWAGVKKNYY